MYIIILSKFKIKIKKYIFLKFINFFFVINYFILKISLNFNLITI